MPRALRAILAALAVCCRMRCADQTLAEWASADQKWLCSRVTPNAAVPDPDPTRRRLLISYDIPPEKFPAGYHRSATYDNALAALSFTLSGQTDAAAFTLGAMTRLIRSDGSLWFSYSTANSWPNESEHDSALVRAGSIGWAGYAITFFLTHAPPCAPGDASCERERASLLSGATRLAAYLVSLEAVEPKHPCRGLLRQGYGSIRLSYRAESREVAEEYIAEPALGFSTENNISSWFFLRDLGRLTGEARWTDAADRIRHALLGVAWDNQIGQFDQGFSPGGQRDATRALDCASWGALFLLAAGESEKAQTALANLETYYGSRDGASSGYRPYFDEPVYPSLAVGRFYFPGDPRKQWRSLPLVWSEGSLGVALARLRTGHSDLARQIADGLRPLRAASGGLLYASRAVPHQMSDAPSVAASSWLIFVTRALDGDPRAEALWK